MKLEGTGYRRGRKGSPLANTHRQYCDSRCIPQVILMKASGGRMVDNVLVDLSPLRVVPSEAREILDRAVEKAAEEAGLTLCKLEEIAAFDLENDPMEDSTFDFANDPVWKLPIIVSSGVFEGERSKAQRMCKQLVASLKIINEDSVEHTKLTSSGGPRSRKDAGAKGGGRTKLKRNKRRSRGGGRSPEDSIRGLF